MSVDKLVDSTQLDSDLTTVANAIRAKSGGSSQLAFPAGFVSEIQAIPSGGGGGSQNAFISEFTPASGSSAITFSLSEIGFVPDVCAYYAQNFVVQESYSAWTAMASENAQLLLNKGTCQGYTKTGAKDYTSGVYFTVSETTVTVSRYGSWQAGTTYKIVFAKIKE